jgi:hypothetical protein
VAVPAVDDDRVVSEMGREFVERGVDGVACGDHQPDSGLVAEFGSEGR